MTSQASADLLWGLKRGAVCAAAFSAGLGATVLFRGATAYSAYRPSAAELVLSSLGIWVLGGAIIGLLRPLGGKPAFRFLLAVFGGVMAFVAVGVAVFGFTHLAIWPLALGGTLFGARVGGMITAGRAA